MTESELTGAGERDGGVQRLELSAAEASLLRRALEESVLPHWRLLGVELEPMDLRRGRVVREISLFERLLSELRERASS